MKVLDVRYGALKKEKERSRLEFMGVGSDGLRGGMADRGTVQRAVEGVTVIYHLAINWDGATWRHRLPPTDLFDVNIRGTLNLLEEARRRRVRHFLFASSSAVYGEGELEAVDEEAACKPELFDGDPGPAYAILKLALERLCLMYCRLYGLPVTAFRIGYVFEPPEEGEVHVDDVVQAFLLATLNKKAYGQVFNVTRDPSVSTRRIEEVLGWEPWVTKEALSGRSKADRDAKPKRRVTTRLKH